MTTPLLSDMAPSTAMRPGRFGQVIRLGVAPLVLCMSGFFTADFLLSGVYSWPRTSRIFALTLTIAVLTYEFVYKEQGEGTAEGRRAVIYSCLIPYLVGGLALVALATLAG